MAKNRFIFGLVVGVVLFAGMPALADRRELDLFVGAKAEYNDNIFLTADDQVADFITTLSGGLKFLNQTERSDVNLSAILERAIYADNNNLNATDRYYKGRFGYLLTPRLSADLDAAYSRDSRPDRDLAASGLFLSTVPRKIQDYGAQVQYALTDISVSSLYYRYGRQDFEPRRFDVSLPDYRAHRAGMGLEHRLDQLLQNTTGRFNFGFNRFSYPETQTQTTVFLGTLGLAYDLNEKWRVSIDMGPNYYESKFTLYGLDFVSDGWGGTGMAKIAYMGEHGGSSVTLYHGIEPATGRDGSAQRTYALFDFFYGFVERGRVGFATGYFINKTNAGQLALRPLDERTVNVRPWLRFDIIFDKLYLESSYTYSYVDDRTSDRTRGRTRGRNLIWLQLGFDWAIFE